MATLGSMLSDAELPPGGSAEVFTTTVNFATAARSGTFVITDQNVTTASKIVPTQAGDATLVGGTPIYEDEPEMEPLTLSATARNGAFLLVVSARDGLIKGDVKINYIIG